MNSTFPVVNLLDYQIAWQAPLRLTEINSWHSHIPFAFTLVQILKPKIIVELGVHKGDSYCAFCQAVNTLQLSTLCFGIDNWEGDKHAGSYDQNILTDIKQYHDPLYARFSTLIKNDFDIALKNFADASIDLLHIDGLHTYDAVKHDFETWLPKLSDKAVVLFHDTNVHEGDFGVWRFWQELKQNYPTLEFKHGFGLGLLAVGKEINPTLQFFLANPEQAQKIASYFAHLGEQINLKRINLHLQQKQIEKNIQLKNLENELIEKNQAIIEFNQDINQLKQEKLISLKSQEVKSTQYQQRLEFDLHQSNLQNSRLQEELKVLKDNIEYERVEFSRLQEEARIYQKGLEEQLEKVQSEKVQLLEKLTSQDILHKAQLQYQYKLMKKQIKRYSELKKYLEKTQEEKDNLYKELINSSKQLTQLEEEIKRVRTNYYDLAEALYRFQDNYKRDIEDIENYIWAFKLTKEVMAQRIQEPLLLEQSPIEFISSLKALPNNHNSLTGAIKTKLNKPLQLLKTFRYGAVEGAIDLPSLNSTVTNCLEVKGWAYSRQARIKSIEAWIDDVLIGEVKYGEIRLDVVLNQPWQLVANCGFSANFSLKNLGLTEGLKNLQIKITDSNANKLELKRSLVLQFNDQTEKLTDINPTREPPFMVCIIDEPFDNIKVTNYLNVRGWATSQVAPVEKVEVFLDGIKLGIADYGEERKDVWENRLDQITPYCGYKAKFPINYFNTEVDLHNLTVKVTDALGNCKSVSQEFDLLPSTIIEIKEEEALETNDFKKLLALQYQNSLNSFLTAGSKLIFSPPEKPLVSVLLVLYNRAELTFQCLRSLLDSNLTSYEVIIVDNASEDDTGKLLGSLQGVTIVRNSENHHFLVGSNQAAKLAKGEYLLFLNNDAQVLPASIASAVNTLQSDDAIGAVGGKILFLDGKLQEAGSIIWQDGTCTGYGRNDSPFQPMYMYKREVDYCSGAFLLTPRQLFLDNNGFDEIYKPAYYEEADYCIRLRKQGKRIIYDPNAVILHYEFASSRSSDAALKLQSKNQKIFVERQSEWLKANQLLPQRSHIEARQVSKYNKRVLFLDDRVPHIFYGSGSPRAREMLLTLLDLNCFVTFYPRAMFGEILDKEDWHSIYSDIPPEVEVMANYGFNRLGEFLNKRQGYYDIVLVSRPNNMDLINEMLVKYPRFFEKTKIVYDAEAVFAKREVLQKRLNGEEVSQAIEQAMVKAEIDIAKNADMVLCVSKLEQEIFETSGFSKSLVLSSSLKVNPGNTAFNKRKDLLFVGAVYNDDTPNSDSLIWFLKNIFPNIEPNLPNDSEFKIAGIMRLEKIKVLATSKVNIMGRVENLSSIYDNAKIFVAPTRFAAGIPLKILEASAYGVPVVTTSLLAKQLDWIPDKDLLVADDPKVFAEKCLQLYNDFDLWCYLRENALTRIKQENSKEVFLEKMKSLLQL
jgi:GT2 family glycosyltransferase